MATILYIDTAHQHTQVALSQNGQCVAELLHQTANEQAAVLNLLIERLCAQNGMALSALDAIAVNAGPGSYTGLRVGLGVAKGLCYALEKPIMLFDKLYLLIGQNSSSKPLLMVLKARTGEGFAMSSDGNKPMGHIFYETFPFTDYAKHRIISDDDFVLSEVSGSEPLPSHQLDCGAWIKQAEQRFMENEFDNVAYCEPFYLKAPFTTTAKKKI